MNSWEREAAAEQRRAKVAGAGACNYAKETLETVFSDHCTPRARERPQGRLAAPFFQRPPEYDPANELNVALTVNNERVVTIETVRSAGLGGGRYRYGLHKVGQRWFIDSVQYFLDGAWVQHTL
jgi:hypothetical protein